MQCCGICEKDCQEKDGISANLEKSKVEIFLEDIDLKNAVTAVKLSAESEHLVRKELTRMKLDFLQRICIQQMKTFHLVFLIP